MDKKILASLERLSQVFRFLLREEARKRGLSPIQAQFLVYLLHHSGELRRVSRLARDFGLTPATVSEAVGSLEVKGWVQREPHPEDGRITTLRLTPAGEELAASLSNWAGVVEEHLSGYPSEEKEVVMWFLMTLISSLQKSGYITVARMCLTRRFFRQNVRPDTVSPHHCALLDAPLAVSDLRVDCPEHELAVV